MYHEITIKRIEVLSVSEEGMAEIAVHLDGTLDSNFAHWFRDPTAHNYTPQFNTHNCRVEDNRIVCVIDALAVKSAVPLIREYVAKANEYARAIQEEKRTGVKRKQELKTESDKRSEQLQDEIDKL
jgi:hypothetical protein